MSEITMWLESGEIKMRFRYDVDFIAAIKDNFCSAWRSYNNDTKVWGVTVTKYPALRKLVGQHFLRIEELGELSPIRVTDVAIEDLATVLVELPRPVLEKVYKTIMFEVHPDRGGSVEMAQKVSEAWEKLRRGGVG